MDKIELEKVVAIQAMRDELGRLVVEYIDDHERLPRDAWPDRHNRSKLICRCDICERARESLMRWTGQEGYDG